MTRRRAYAGERTTIAIRFTDTRVPEVPTVSRAIFMGESAKRDGGFEGLASNWQLGDNPDGRAELVNSLSGQGSHGRRGPKPFFLQPGYFHPSAVFVPGGAKGLCQRSFFFRREKPGPDIQGDSERDSQPGELISLTTESTEDTEND
jgi:hypothetical protein